MLIICLNNIMYENSQILNNIPVYMYLVTGAAGFIGFHLSLELLKKNKIVIGVDNVNNYYDQKIKYDRLKILKQFSKFKFFKVDLSNNKHFSKKINRYKNKIKIIIHLAGQAGVRYSIINPSSYIQNNIMSYVHLLEFFKIDLKNKKHFSKSINKKIKPIMIKKIINNGNGV